MNFEGVIKDKTMTGPTESLPNYDGMCDSLLTAHKDNPNVSRKEVEKMLGDRGNLDSLLMAFVRKGFAMHGSHTLFDVIQPRQGADGKDIPGNKHYAVYATDVPSIAIFVSLAPNNSVMTFGVDTNTGSELRLPVFGLDDPSKSLIPGGYIYIINGNSLEPTEKGAPGNYQHISREPVRPVLIIPTVPTDFKNKVGELHP